MRISCGIDIIEVNRIKNSIESSGDKFLKRIYTEKEIEYCEGKNVQKYESYAGRFAAKEAIFKGISQNLDNKYSIEWKDIEILNDEQGKPIVFFKNVNIREIQNIDVSISHIKEYATANAVILYKE